MKIFIIISNIIAFYSVVLWIRIFLTWLPSQRDPNHVDGKFVLFIKRITDPVLNIFRSKTKRSVIDLSALWAFMCLNFLQTFFMILGRKGSITVSEVLILLVYGVWQYFISVVLILLCIILVIRCFIGRNPTNPRNALYLSSIDPIIRKPVNFVASILETLFKKKRFTDQTFVLSALVFYVLLYIAIKMGLGMLFKF